MAQRPDAIPSYAGGTFQIKGEAAKDTTLWCTAAGIRHIDTATVYRNEQHVGAAIQQLIQNGVDRQDIFITSKLSPKDQGYESTKQAVQLSLEKLQLDYIDMYLIHWPGKSGMKRDDPQQPQFRKESWRALEDMRRDGLVKYIGVSNYTIEHLQELMQYCRDLPAVNQVELHPLCQQRKLRAFCQEHAIAVQAHSPLGTGKLLSHPVVCEIAQAIHATTAQVLIKWALSTTSHIVVKSANEERIKSNVLGTTDSICLNQEHLGRLNDLDEDLHYCWDPHGVT
eukprot:m.93049 g.93049  ORF g.93049 m.93049 type:complete len:282 (-) comp12995_c1_seq1:3238-4083(-)